MLNISVMDILEKKRYSVRREWVYKASFFQEILSDPSFENAVLGNYSVYNIRTQTCYVLHSQVLYDYPISTAAISREIISMMFKRKGIKGYPKNHRTLPFDFLAAPLYAIPTNDTLLYLDLKAAFLQIYSRMPICVRERKGKYQFDVDWFFPHLPFDIAKHKLVRNGIVGCWRSCHTTRIKGGKIHRQEVSIPLANFENWNFVQAVLHRIATIAKQCGAVYVHTDGYIFPFDSQWRDFISYCDEYDFKLSLKAIGEGQVWGIGRYQIGDVFTKVSGELPMIDKVYNHANIELSLNTCRHYNPYWSKINDSIFERPISNTSSLCTILETMANSP